MVFGMKYARKMKPLEGSIKEVSIIIPFRNEKGRISDLLADIEGLKVPNGLKYEFIFVDDHSNDCTGELILAKNIEKSKLIQNIESGKKEAIRIGVNNAQYEWVLTWDADIRVKSEYLNSLLVLEESDLWILPVKMTSRNLISNLGSLDFSWLQMLTYYFAKRGNAFLANGANLLFRKSFFLAIDEKRDDYQMPSGDDMFLLRNFQNAKAVINASNRIELTVDTMAPDTFKSLIKQRKRWLGKMGRLKSTQVQVLSLALFIFILTGGVCLGFLIGTGSLLFAIPLFIKFWGEYIFMNLYTRARVSLADFLAILIHQLFYPIYLLAIRIIPLKTEERWDH